MVGANAENENCSGLALALLLLLLHQSKKAFWFWPALRDHQRFENPGISGAGLWLPGLWLRSSVAPAVFFFFLFYCLLLTPGGV